MEKLAVIGLGFVGLPLSLTYTLHGIKVYGVDINKEYVENLKNGHTHVYEEYNGKHIEEILKESLKNGLFVPTTSLEDGLKEVQNIIVTVGIPIENDNEVKMEAFVEAIKNIGKNLKKGDMVLLRSTVPPLTTKNIVKPILEEESGLEVGKDFYLAYSSERIAEGRAFEEFQTMPVAVAGMDSESTKRGKQLLELINPNIIEASTPEVVEISKLIENASRDVNIAIVNELSTLTAALGIDVMEVINVANTHKRVKLLTPGIGVGGHCIPFASKYIFYSSDKLSLEMPLLHAARSVNDSRPFDIVNRIEKTLKTLGKSIKEIKVAFLGIAMKDNSSDISESPAIKLKEIFKSKGAKVEYFDPKVNGELEDMKTNEYEVLKNADVVIIPIVQEEINYDINEWAKYIKKDAIIFDAKGVIDKNTSKILGYTYLSL
jgi:nucleotide sugar dehydrogenase